MNGVVADVEEGFPCSTRAMKCLDTISLLMWIQKHSGSTPVECLLGLIAFGAKSQSKHSFASQCLRITNTGKHTMSVYVLLLLQLKSLVAFRCYETPFFLNGERSLFAYAKAAENHTEQIIGGKFTRDFIQTHLRQAQMFGQ